MATPKTTITTPTPVTKEWLNTALLLPEHKEWAEKNNLYQILTTELINTTSLVAKIDEGMRKSLGIPSGVMIALKEAGSKQLTELPIDYYKKLPLYTGNGYNVPDFEESTSTWPSIHHSQFDEVVYQINTNVRLVVCGRHKIGKSFMISQIAKNLWKGKQPVFYIGLPLVIQGDLRAVFINEIHECLHTFDNTVPKPVHGNLHSQICIELIGWLLRSGVHVIIDEFQNLHEFSSRFRVLIDEQGDDFKAKLICLGSHTSELRSMVTAGNEPLYGRGFHTMIITPTSPSSVCKLLQQIKLADSSKLALTQVALLYICFDGLLEWYKTAFTSGKLDLISQDINKLVEYVKALFDSEPFYAKQLFPKESAVLELAYQQMRFCDTFGKMQSYILHKAALNTVDHKVLRDLVAYHFLGICDSLSGDTTKERQHPQYFIQDAPLAMLAALKNGRNTLTSTADRLFKDMVHKMVEETSSKHWKIWAGNWREPCTEIDFVAVSEDSKTITWGSSKLSASAQDAHNLMCHVVSYFNNRAWEDTPYFYYHHILLFISVQEEEKEQFNNTHIELNKFLVEGRTEALQTLCQSKLSNFGGGGNPFQWNISGKFAVTKVQPTESPKKAHFTIAKCHALDLQDLIDGVNLDVFIPK